MQILTTIHDMRSTCSLWKQQGLRVALVPTMGYFHEGHLSLMRHAARVADKVVVSLFVNPTQFAPGEDLDAYPRDAERDGRLAEAAGVSALFLPAPETMYPDGHDTWVEVPSLSAPLCGVSRPAHFRGVATVVLKLLNIVNPDVAVFGEKDWQQLTVIRRMAHDLFLPVEIVGQPIVREADGLAMSSRNAYLTPEERLQAPGIRKALLQVRDGAAKGVSPRMLLTELDRSLRALVPLGKPDYLEIVNPQTLASLMEETRLEGPALIAVAVRLGKARLIDNLTLLPAGPHRASKELA